MQAFVPAPLPPQPPVRWSPELREKFDEAFLALGRLDSVTTLLPDTSIFLYMYVRKEAVLSSMIEGTQKRNRIFSYARYVAILNQGTELPGQPAVE